MINDNTRLLGKTIRLFLVDGSPSGMRTAEIINWTGQVMLIPRSLLPRASKRPEVKRTGVYILFGPDPENMARNLAYIGEGDNVVDRILAHDKKKDFWTHAVIVTSKDDNITKSHGRYLESRLISMATTAGRATLENTTAPDPTPLPEPDVADMEYFLDQIQMILPVLGYNLLQAQPDVERDSSADADVSPVFEISSVGIAAQAKEIDGEFVVLKDSTARLNATKSWRSHCKEMRESLIQGDKVAKLDSEKLIFKENVSFSSPSMAASVVLSASANGRITWKIKGTDKTYQDWYDEKLTQVDTGSKTE